MAWSLLACPFSAVGFYFYVRTREVLVANATPAQGHLKGHCDDANKKMSPFSAKYVLCYKPQMEIIFTRLTGRCCCRPRAPPVFINQLSLPIFALF
jgi:hypothetical protein